MDNKIFVMQLDGLFKKYSFVKKGMKWFFDAGSFFKILELQKSRFGNFYYINYGYILKNIKLDGLSMHISDGLGSLDDSENTRIKQLLDFESAINDDERLKDLERFIVRGIFDKFARVSTEREIYCVIKKRSTLNDIPLVVKDYFNIPIKKSGFLRKAD